MSTIALDFPNSLPLRRSFNIRWIVILVAGLVLVASIILAASVSVRVDSPSSLIAIPVPVAPIVDAQIQPSVTATLSPRPVVIAVPVATPPSQ